MNRQGIAIIIALIIVGILGVLSAGILALNLTDYRASLRNLNLTRAIYLGEAGVDVAMNALRGDANYPGTNFVALGNNLGGYAIQVTPDGPSRRIIRSAGSYPDNNPASYAYATKTIEAAVQVDQTGGPPLSVGAVRNITVRGHVEVDSYNSSQGGYAQTRRDNGDIGVNWPADEGIVLRGHSTIRGDLYVAPQADPYRVIDQRGENVTVTGRPLSMDQPLNESWAPMPPDTPPQRELRVSGSETVTLPGGTYQFDEVKVEGQLIFTGPATVYINEELEMEGHGVITSGDRPTNLTVYMPFYESEIKLEGDSRFFGKIQAPHAEVKIAGRAHLFGALMGNRVNLGGNARIHRDEALAGGGGSTLVSLLSWREWTP